MRGRPTRPGGCQAQTRTVPGARNDCPRRGAPGRARSGAPTRAEARVGAPCPNWGDACCPMGTRAGGVAPCVGCGTWPCVGAGTAWPPSAGRGLSRRARGRNRSLRRPGALSGRGRARHRLRDLACAWGRAQRWLLRRPAGESRAPWEPDRGTGDCRSLLFFLLSGCPGARGDGLRRRRAAARRWRSGAGIHACCRRPR